MAATQYYKNNNYYAINLYFFMAKMERNYTAQWENYKKQKIIENEARQLNRRQTVYRENMNSNNFIHRTRNIVPPESTAKSLIFELNSIGTVFKQQDSGQVVKFCRTYDADPKKVKEDLSRINGQLNNAYVSHEASDAPTTDPYTWKILKLSTLLYLVFLFLTYINVYHTYNSAMTYLAIASIIFGLLLHFVIIVKKGVIWNAKNRGNEMDKLCTVVRTSLLNTIAFEN